MSWHGHLAGYELRTWRNENRRGSASHRVVQLTPHTHTHTQGSRTKGGSHALVAVNCHLFVVICVCVWGISSTNWQLTRQRSPLRLRLCTGYAQLLLRLLSDWRHALCEFLAGVDCASDLPALPATSNCTQTPMAYTYTIYHIPYEVYFMHVFSWASACQEVPVDASRNVARK